eukprot:gene7076-9620_t
MSIELSQQQSQSRKDGSHRRSHLEIGYEDEKLKDNGVLPSKALGGLIKVQDNAAVALVHIPKGSVLIVDGHIISQQAPFDIPEGHRFVTQHVSAQTELRSWGITFGIALKDLVSGELLCNVKSLQTFRDRQSSLSLPSDPNFSNAPFRRYVLPESSFSPAPSTQSTAPALSAIELSSSFLGYERSHGRGVGTRNYVVVIGTSARSAGFVRAVEALYKHHFNDLRTRMPHTCCHGVVAVSHTEGDSLESSKIDVPNNWIKVLRTLSGFIVHPNIGGVLLVDHGSELLSNTDHDYSIDGLALETMSLSERPSYTENIDHAQAKVNKLLKIAEQMTCSKFPAKHLIMAQQCGGSDAFSGLSANPLAGWLARRIVCLGGSALLAETDELIGAESYVLARTRSYSDFLDMVDCFYDYANQRGHTPEGNPSGGNLLRGLYNITLKSAGAAMKKLPDVRLDHVIEYGELLRQHGHGYAFMDSPGNDLESIAGQVAAGCNLILFTTGNGSITNFPFVPTIKVLSTTARYNLLKKDMDINAGAYLDKTMTLDQLGESAFEILLNIASGCPSKGELARHHQFGCSTDLDSKDAKRSGRCFASQLASLLSNGHALTLSPSVSVVDDIIELFASTQLLPAASYDVPSIQVSEYIGVIIPTSLCSGQVALHITNDLNHRIELGVVFPGGISRFATLPHTEGCGHSSGDHEALVLRTLTSYARHPIVAHAVFLEHGCEKTHNACLKLEMEELGIDTSRFGFASIQLDGGYENVTDKVCQLFSERESRIKIEMTRQPARLSELRVGFIADVNLSQQLQAAIGRIITALATSGGMVAVTGKLACARVLHGVFESGSGNLNATLGYGQFAQESEPVGIHIMSASTTRTVELLAGLCASGVEIVVAIVGPQSPIAPHPIVPIFQCCETSPLQHSVSQDIDLCLSANVEDDEESVAKAWSYKIVDHMVCYLSRHATPALFQVAQPEFQLARAEKAISM